jgi:ribosomal protein S10
MEIFSITVYSKNKKSLNIFLNFLNFFIKNKVKKIKFNAKKLKKTTLLKSPHVHKSAQEQFEYRIYKKIIWVTSFSVPQWVIFFKKSFKKSFYDLKITVNYSLVKKKYKIVKILNFKYFNLNSEKYVFKVGCKNLHFEKKLKTYKFLKFLNFNGLVLLNF